MGYTGRDFEYAADALLAGHADPKTIVTRVIGLDALQETFELLRGPNTETKVQVMLNDYRGAA
jgi:threonine dehydrogenase-like Zn-dependent dehydrogenase